MRFDILTLFPESVEPYLASSILGRAHQAEHIQTAVWNIRDFAQDKHKTTDDTPYGGGAGMVMKIEPIAHALQAAQEKARNSKHPTSPKGFAGRGEIRKRKIVVLSARGEQFTQAKAHTYSELDHLILICGRYEGIDQRVVDYLADEEISIGPYVLAGGEIAALAVLEATARLIPGVLGNPESLTEESFSSSSPTDEANKEYPQYTKPEVYNDWQVPPVLLSGNHAAIKEWRDEHKKQ